MDTSDIMVCVDCMTVAEASEIDDEPDRESWGLIDPYDRGRYAITDDHDGFGTWPCDACGSTLAGERFGYDLID